MQPRAKKTASQPAAKKRGRPKKLPVAVDEKKQATVAAPVIPETQEISAQETAITAQTPKKAHKAEKYFYAVGRRKTAVAKIRAYENSDQTTVNGKELSRYFQSKSLIKIALAPVIMLGLDKKISFKIFVSGGGIKAQAEAVRLAIARSIILRNSEDKPVLKKAGLLTRDSRKKERKKPGLKRARRGPQWAKR